jgi:hypothetical protein
VSDYEQPDKGEKFAPSDHPEWIGRLFLFWPEGVETVNFTRPDGSLDPTDMVTCDVAIIDLPDPENGGRPKFLKGARVGGAALAPQVKKKIGKKVLGRLKQAPRQGNKSGAFYLEDWTPQDVQLAQAYEAQFPRSAYDAPSGAEQQQTGWGQQPPAATPPPAAPAQGGWGAPPAAAPAAPPAPAQQWGAPPAAPPAPPADPFPGAPGLADFLRSRGVDVTGMDEGTARQLAATMPQQ